MLGILIAASAYRKKIKTAPALRDLLGITYARKLISCRIITIEIEVCVVVVNSCGERFWSENKTFDLGFEV